MPIKPNTSTGSTSGAGLLTLVHDLPSLIAQFPVTELVISRKTIRTKVDTANLPKILAVSTRWRAIWVDECQTYYARAGKKPTIQLHRVITDAPAGLTVDHYDHDGLNNLDSNLRVVPIQVNCQNRRAKVGSTGFRNVNALPCGKFRASVMVNWKRVLLGKYPTPELAAQAVEAYRAANGMPTSAQTKHQALAAGAQ